MNLFVEPKSDKIHAKTDYNYGNYDLLLIRDIDKVKPTWTILFWLVLLLTITMIVIEPLTLAIMPLLILPFFITLKISGHNFNWYAFKRKQQRIKVDSDWHRMSIQYEDNPVVQQAMEDLWAEKELLGEFFDPEPWRDQFKYINVELNRQKELEKKQARELASRFKMDYAKTIRETNEIMNKSLE